MAIQTTESYKVVAKSNIDDSSFYSKFDFIPEGAKENATIIASPIMIHTSIDQLNNSKNQMGSKWASLEQGRIKLNGTYEWIKEDYRQTGAFFQPMSNGQRLFQTVPYLEYTLDKTYDIVGAMVYFDDLGKEWAERVKIEYFSNNGSLIIAKEFENSTSEGIFELTGEGVKKVKISILQWSEANRHAKVAQVYPGIFIHFEDKNTYSFELTESVNPFEQIEVPEFVISFDNSNKKFDIVNPKGLVAFLRQRMKIKSQITIGGQPINVGEFLLYLWDDSANDEMAFFKCRPSMAIKPAPYPTLGEGTQTVGQACDIILADEVYTIESGLESITVNKHIGENVSLLDAMSYIAIACSGFWVFNRDGSYHLRKWQRALPNATNDINYNIIFDKPSITQNGLISKVNVKYYTYDTQYNNLKSVDNFIGTDNGMLKNIDSPFIGTVDLANTVGQNALNYFARRLKHSTNYKGDPSIQAGDIVKVENEYGKIPVFLTENKIVFSAEIIKSAIQGVS